jgi:hypothetical protein
MATGSVQMGAAGERRAMMDDMLVEIDTRKMAVSRYFGLKKGQEKGFTGAPFRSRRQKRFSRGSSEATQRMPRRPCKKRSSGTGPAA